jgi:hypothetical protein
MRKSGFASSLGARVAGTRAPFVESARRSERRIVEARLKWFRKAIGSLETDGSWTDGLGQTHRS